jgi:iron complex outermembrane receptor protein
LALRPAKSRHAESGVKLRLAHTLSLDVAAFRIETRDEIVTNASAGGRTDFRNAGGTLRNGIEVAARARLGAGLEAQAAFTALDAEFSGDAADGRRLPGVPRTAAFAELLWRHASGFHAAVELRHASRIYVNEANADAAPAYTVANLRVGHELALQAWRLRSYLRLDNATDRRYAGSVIVAEARGRFFEPAPGRNWFAGMEVGRSF